MTTPPPVPNDGSDLISVCPEEGVISVFDLTPPTLVVDLADAADQPTKQ